MINIFLLLPVFLFSSLLFADPFKDLNIDFLLEDAPSSQTKKSKGPKSKSAKKPFKEVIKNFKAIEGLFTIYWKESTNKAYLSLTPQQLEKIYLAGITRQSGDALYLDGSSMLNEYPFLFKKVGERIQYVNANVLFRADESSPFRKSVERHKSHSILSSTKIESAPHPETGAILVDLGILFIYDMERITMRSQGVYVFDKKDSYFKDIKSFPFNTELEIALHFKGKKGQYIYTLPNSSSMVSSYQISLSAIPETDYSPRLADDRVGHFTTIYQDYTNVMQDSPYIRYINRWHLEKRNPQSKVSEPVKPIVYWIENTVPYELRDAVREGILAWNEAFEAAGFKNAIVVKQMPDDADWDPADVRYSTVRWMFQPGSGYAVGPSRANPYTGELYDADIRISADFVRSFYREQTEFVAPLIGPLAMDFETEEPTEFSSEMCRYGEHLRDEMAAGWDMLTSTGKINGSDEELKQYIHNGLVDLILHEVGHTLGLRHNFKGSSIYSIDQLSDPGFTDKYGISGSVMDYQPINIYDGKNFFQTKPGTYDYWAIEYAYSQSDRSGLSEENFLEEIASRSNDPLLQYGTDEDTFGLSTRGIDPTSNAWDLTNDPMQYFDDRIDLAHELWATIPQHFEKDGEQYSKLRRVFSRGIRQYYSASRNIAKYIGGIYHSRHHVGDPGGDTPFKLVPAAKQKDALDFILTRILAEDAFYFDPELLNKLAPERSWDFRGSVWRMSRIDYPIHDYVRWIQAGTLYRLHHPRIFARIRDNELKFQKGEEIFTLAELFQKITRSLWAELDKNRNINSFRRDLQKTHIEVLSIILLNEKNYFHTDAIALARANLRDLHSRIRESIDSGIFDDYTQAHLSEAANKIQSVYKAQTVIN
ncbi:MAG: zinc-dependent metalloprotease [Candidatus Marinimicrobia bacterium]|nr:zinc-dependent metalloprotease [Candidatus Neomarinimicrobiota bacterium]